MVPWHVRFSVCLAVLTGLIVSPWGRLHVECIDGMACETQGGGSQGERGCCLPDPCESHEPLPPEQKCVLKASDGMDATPPRGESIVPPALDLHLSYVPLEAPARAPAGQYRDISSARPPPHLAPEQGHAPRGPPHTA